MNQAVIETVQTLCRKGNRDSVLTVFQNFPEHFSCIPLNDSNVESKQAINDLLRENVSEGGGGGGGGAVYASVGVAHYVLPFALRRRLLRVAVCYNAAGFQQAEDSTIDSLFAG